MLYRKLSAVFILEFTVILTVIIVCVLLMDKALIRDHLYETHSQSVASAAEELDRTFTETKSILLESVVDDVFQTALSDFYNQEADPETAASSFYRDTHYVDDAFARINSKITNGYLSVWSVRVDGLMYELCADGSFIYDSDVESTDSYQKASADPRSFHWSLYLTSNGPRIILSKMIFADTDPDTVIGYAAINMSFTSWTRVMNGINVGKNGYTYLLDADDTILYPSLGKTFDLEPTTDSGRLHLDAPTSEMVFTPFLENGWKLAVVVKDPQSLASHRMLSYSIIIGGVLVLLFTILLTIFLCYRSVLPLTQLAGQIREMKVEDTELKEPVPPYEDEVKELFDSFNELIRTRDELKENVYDLSLREKEAELKSLQAQINPHFLYNTLDSINWMAMSYGADEISEVVVSLSKMLRFSLNNGKNKISVRDELQQIKGYIYIQQLRFQNSFEVKYDVDDSILDESIIKLLLQPLVENAILHGFDKLEDTGHITICIKDRNDFVFFQVSNDGNQMDLEKMHQTLYPATEEEVKSYGLRNVNDRLLKHYGPQSALKFTVEDGISCAGFRIPKR